MTADPTENEPRNQGSAPDEGTREVQQEALEDTEVPPGATPQNPQHRAAAEQLDDTEEQERRHPD